MNKLLKHNCRGFCCMDSLTHITGT